MKSRHALVLAGAVALGLAAAPGAARADDPVAAEATFAKGRALMKAEKYAEACAAFELSLSLDRAFGTEVNLATCYAKLGKTASAWLHYRDAAATAQKAGEAARAAEARDRAAKIEPTLCRLMVKAPSDAPNEMTVTRDGQRVDRSIWGVGVPVDAGTHEVTASVAGGESVTRKVTTPASTNEACAETVVELPALKPPPTPPPIVGLTPPPPPLRPTTEPIVQPGPAVAAPGDAPSRGGTQRAIGLGLGGLGLVGLGVGSGFAIDAVSKQSAAGCTDAGCTLPGRTEMRAAGSSADVATAALTAGAVLVVAGTIVWLTAPSGRRTQTAIAF